MDPDADEYRVAVEAIATLANLKTSLWDFVLKPAGVPMEIYQKVRSERDTATGQLLSKRKMAPLLLEAVALRPDGSEVIRRIISVAANWNQFYLAQNEYEARATVQKAREIMGQIELMAAREQKQREIAREQELRRLKAQQAEARRQLPLLLAQFDEFGQSKDHQHRGYLLEDLLPRIADVYQVPVVGSFQRNDGGEQLDGALRLDGWAYLVECRWRSQAADIRDLDGLSGKVERSGKQTMGIFLSVEGFSRHVVPLLRQNPSKSIVLMDGDDLRFVLSGEIDFDELIRQKVNALNIRSDPFVSAREVCERGRTGVA